MKEIILYDGSPLLADYNGSAPWRRMTFYFKWDGQYFTLTKKFFDPPYYRFQAVEDADYAALDGAYDQALDLYQQVIFNDKLEWWTKERREYIGFKLIAEWQRKPFVATPPAPDPNEYLYLSAYARFRIMVLHIVRGYESDAQVVYQTLLKKFPGDTPGSVFARMAEGFWETYQSTHSIGEACIVAQGIASPNEKEWTGYFIDDYVDYGYPKASYTIDQLCPFK